MSFWDTKAPLLLLYREIRMWLDLSRYDLMLTPQFYVLKREELPIKYAYQAKKLAPSILGELIGEGDFTYEAFQEGGSWVFVAYSLKEISEFLHSRGGSIDRVGRLYFAEQIREKLDVPLVLDDQMVLTRVNDTATIVPVRFLDGSKQLRTFDEAFRPEKGFTFKRSYDSYFDLRQTIMLAGVLSVLGFIWFAEGYRYHRAVDAAEVRYEHLLDANPSLRSSYTREAAWKKYSATNTLQRKIRDGIKAVSRLTGKEIKLDTLAVDTRGYKATLFVPDTPEVHQALRNLLKKKPLKNSRLNGKRLEVSEAFQ